jgi:hypothetical protein
VWQKKDRKPQPPARVSLWKTFARSVANRPNSAAIWTSLVDGSLCSQRLDANISSLRGVIVGGNTMSVIEKTVALLDALTPTDVQALPPAQRRRFADICKHWAALADRADVPKAGVLCDLKRGSRYE